MDLQIVIFGINILTHQVPVKNILIISQDIELTIGRKVEGKENE